MASKPNDPFKLPRPSINPKDLRKPEQFILFDEVTRDKPPSSGGTGSGGGCYIATAVYGDYDAPEVIVLREYRDSVLSKNVIGRLLIKIYYTVSPPIAARLHRMNRINHAVKKILDGFIKRI